MKNYNFKKNRLDSLLLFTVVFLSFLGLAMEISASYVYAGDKFLDNYFFIKKHLFFLLFGLFLMYFISFLKYDFYKHFIFFFYIATGAMLLLTLITGVNIKGAKRWLNLFVITFQTSELVKIFIIFFLSNYYAKFIDKRGSFIIYVLKPLIIISPLYLLVLLQPDYSTTLLLIVITMAMMWVVNVKIAHFLLIGSVGAPALITLILIAPYRMKRIFAFLDCWRDPLGSGYQTIQSMIAIYSGGILGVGLGESKQKLFYLPESHNDFIFSIIIEEGGILVAFLILALFSFLIYRCLRVSLRTDDLFGKYLSFGITAIISIQVIFNIAVALGLFPVTGLTLPFISYGGASLLITMALMGVILNISRYVD